MSVSGCTAGILQEAADAVTSECEVRAMNPAGILLKDWLLPYCAGKKKLGTMVSLLLVVSNSAANNCSSLPWLL